MRRSKKINQSPNNTDKVSVIVPFYNERETLLRTVPKMISFMHGHFKNFELLLVDDGSTDDSRAVSETLTKTVKQARVIGYRNNAGRGQAIKTGFEQANGTIVGYLDCDLELTLEEMYKACQLLSAYDIVIASKFSPGSVVTTPAVRRISSILYNKLTSLILGSHIQDHQAGLKFFRADAARSVVPLTSERGWLWDTEMLSIAERQQLSIYEMPVTITYGFRKLRGSFIADFLKLIIMLVRLKQRLDKDIP